MRLVAQFLPDWYSSSISDRSFTPCRSLAVFDHRRGDGVQWDMRSPIEYSLLTVEQQQFNQQQQQLRQMALGGKL